MYNDTIKVANKIVTEENLRDIFSKMNEEIESSKIISKQEELENEKYELMLQTWTCKGYEGEIRVTINFYDDTTVTIDNYNDFITVFNSRLHEIKQMWVRFRCSYWIQPPGGTKDYISQHIDMSIYENKMDINVSLRSLDKKMDDIYTFIKEIILNAPEKYDRVIKKRNQITNKVAFALGIIPSIIILTVLAFIPIIREAYALTLILFPAAAVILGFAIGRTLFCIKLDNLYKYIIPERKYAGYDRKNNKGIYKDDIDRFTSTGEILIGKNIDNLKYREEIRQMEETYGSYIKYEIVAVIVLSILMVVLGKLI